MPVTILRHDLDHTCSSEVLHRIKGKTKDGKIVGKEETCVTSRTLMENLLHIYGSVTVNGDLKMRMRAVRCLKRVPFFAMP